MIPAEISDVAEAVCKSGTLSVLTTTHGDDAIYPSIEEGTVHSHKVCLSEEC